jgi:hypothetical protein
MYLNTQLDKPVPNFFIKVFTFRFERLDFSDHGTEDFCVRYLFAQVLHCSSERCDVFIEMLFLLRDEFAQRHIRNVNRDLVKL